MILSALTGKDARYIIYLPGDFDNVPKVLSKEENKEILKKYGFDKVLDKLNGRCK